MTLILFPSDLLSVKVNLKRVTDLYTCNVPCIHLSWKYVDLCLNVENGDSVTIF